MRFKRNETDVHAVDRQQAMLAARRLWAAEEGVDPDLIQALFRLLVDPSSPRSWLCCPNGKLGDATDV